MELKEEIIELSRGINGLGFNIKGGIDSPYFKNDEGVFITKIRDNGTAYEDGRLKEGDKVLEVNGKNLRKTSHLEAVQSFRDAGSKVVILVQHNAEALIKKKIQEERKQILKEPVIEESNRKGSSLLLTIVGVSVVVLGAAFIVKKFDYKIPDFKSMKISSLW